MGNKHSASKLEPPMDPETAKAAVTLTTWRLKNAYITNYEICTDDSGGLYIECDLYTSLKIRELMKNCCYSIAFITPDVLANLGVAGSHDTPNALYNLGLAESEDQTRSA